MKPRDGFGLLEITIALAIMGIAMVAFTQLMSGTFRGQRRIEDKTIQTDFANRIQNVIYDESSCSAALLSGPPLIFDPDDLAAFNSDPAMPKITLAFGDGTKFREGTDLETLSLRLRNEMLPANSGKYEGTLRVSAPGTSPKSVLKPSELGLVLLTVPEGTAGLRKVVKCFSRNEVDGQRTCDSLGGKWIKSLDRCLFGNELRLSSNEWIDPQEFKTDGPLEGAFVTKCFYRWGTQIATYNCMNVSSNWVARCMYDPKGPGGAPGWVVKLPKSAWYYYRCEKGVAIDLPDQSRTILSDNELTDKVYVGDIPEGGEGKTISTSSPLTKSQLITNYEILNDVRQCYTDPNAVQAQACNQGANAVEGKTGSCVFIDRGFAQANAVAEPQAVNQAKYTGWIYVLSARTLVPTGSGPNRLSNVQEAWGRKCYMTETVKSGAQATISPFFTDTKDAADATVTNVLTDPKNRWQHVTECGFIGGNGTSLEPSPPTSPTPPTSGAAYKGQYLMRYVCDQSAINIDNLVGAGTFGAPSLLAKSCWYFKDVPVSPDFYGNAGVVSGAGGKKLFTGWMYLKANLPDTTYLTDANNYISPQPLRPLTYINAVPCNVGVRLSQ